MGMKFSREQIEAVRRSGLIGAAATALTGDELYEAAYDALTNEAPVIKSYTGEQDKGAYDITIRGVPGAYFVSALEYDDEGVFDDITTAEAAVYRHYGEFIIGQDGDDE
jgi:hypothetical protein